MTDRRALWSNGAVAHSSLKGQVAAGRFTEGVDLRVLSAPAAPLLNRPGGARERELLWGQRFCVLDTRDGWAFGFARADGYTGYIEADRLGPEGLPVSHRVSVRQTMALGRPDFKATDAVHLPLSLGTDVAVKSMSDRWATIEGASDDLYVPSRHLAPLAEPESDPVRVAARLLGTPYVWGGNSCLGIDCSGLVQIACRVCGIDCPGDSDQQAKALGQTLPPGTPPLRGDLFFWKGHVAWVSDAETLLHANAFHMAVARESLPDALTRINAQGDGPVLRHARLTAL